MMMVYREDNFAVVDQAWISSLRFTNPGSSSLGKTGKHAPSKSDAPPAFYEKDMEKWHKLKF